MEQSSKFMATVSVYDIANQVWYDQNTTGAPGALAQGCTVVASAQDGSSHNIYWYGGFDGLHLTDAFSDDVWILSVPSFQWVKVYSGTASHARAGHRCTKPYPDQMFVIGGYSSLSGGQPSCLDGGIIQIFNLSSAAWIDSYDPTKWSNYTVPSAVYQIIGGTATGSATESSPSPSGFANATMTALFGTSYNASKITNWYPYTPAQTGSNNRTTLLPIPVVHNGTPKFLAPVLGVVLGLIFILLLITAILLWRRRKLLGSHAGTQSEAGTLDNRFWVSNWLRGTPADAKAPTVTTDETISSPYEEENRPFMPEVGGTQVHEMMGMQTPFPIKLPMLTCNRYFPTRRTSRYRLHPHEQRDQRAPQWPRCLSLRHIPYLPGIPHQHRIPCLPHLKSTTRHLATEQSTRRFTISRRDRPDTSSERYLWSQRSRKRAFERNQQHELQQLWSVRNADGNGEFCTSDWLETRGCESIDATTRSAGIEGLSRCGAS
jgi:hypothetical protein